MTAAETSFLSQRKTFVLFQQNRSVLIQQNTSFLSQQKTFVFFKQQRFVLFQQNTSSLLEEQKSVLSQQFRLLKPQIRGRAQNHQNGPKWCYRQTSRPKFLFKYFIGDVFNCTLLMAQATASGALLFPSARYHLASTFFSFLFGGL